MGDRDFVHVLGVESSCDEMACAVVRHGREILASVVQGQADVHRPYGGVVPELASRDHVRAVSSVVDQALAESGVALGDLDGLLETISPVDTSYDAYGSDDPVYSPKSKADVRKFYQAFIASGATRLELDVDRLVADEDCVLTEGVMKMAYPGATLIAMGHAVDDPDAYYLYQTRMATLWPFGEDGLAKGEDTYTGWDGFAGIADRKLAPDELGELDQAALKAS